MLNFQGVDKFLVRADSESFGKSDPWVPLDKDCQTSEGMADRSSTDHNLLN